MPCSFSNTCQRTKQEANKHCLPTGSSVHPQEKHKKQRRRRRSRGKAEDTYHIG
ncbi:hypothetical protein SO802_011271 [Lithocarpus litseifolius]|uniref:Uncharacterized protein n=1 Tax=Lithocarpus litseifolius TaxID=425828 RepID=A0AAW2D2W4_9ROSI